MIGRVNMRKFSILISVIFYGLMFGQIAQASVLYAGSAQQTVSVGQSFVVDWFLDTQGQSVNAIKLDVQFSDQTLAVTSAEPGNSLVSLWVQQPTVHGNMVSLEGGIPGGARSNNLPVFRTTFAAKAVGTATISLLPSSEVLLNDGQGTKDNLSFSQLTFVIAPAGTNTLVSSASHPDQTKWYTSHNVSLQLTTAASKEYSYSFSSNAEIIPDNAATSVPSQLTFNNLPDGVYYFKLNEKSGENTWQEAAVFRVQIDSTPPQDFSPVISSDASLFGGQPFVSFNAVDKTSGIDHYEIKNGAFGKFVMVQSPWQIHRALVGSKIIIRAFDKAGNMREVSIIYAGYLSVSAFYVLLALLIFIVVILLGYVVKRKKQNSQITGWKNFLR